jgi:hypothetical protein
VKPLDLRGDEATQRDFPRSLSRKVEWRLSGQGSWKAAMGAGWMLRVETDPSRSFKSG